jgi:hypothetical protein
MAFEDAAFDKGKNPLDGGLDENEMTTTQRMTFKGAAYVAQKAPDVFFQSFLSNQSVVNNPPVFNSVAVDMTGFLYALTDVSIKNATSCTLRPWFWNDLLLEWVSGTEETITRNTRLKTQVDGALGYYVEIVEILTNNPTAVKINIAIAGASN